MKHTIPVILLLAGVTGLTVGCDRRPTTSQQLEAVQAKTKEAGQDLKDYSYAQKTEFVAKRESQLNEINRDLDQLSAKIEKSSATAQAEAKPKLQALREKTAQLSKQLDEVKNASESTWDNVKAGSAKAYDELKESFQQARQWLSDKIAP